MKKGMLGAFATSVALAGTLVGTGATAARAATETVLINGRPVTFVRQPSWTCTACAAACVAAANESKVCTSAARAVAGAVGGWGGLILGVMADATCDQNLVNEPCASICCN